MSEPAQSVSEAQGRRALGCLLMFVVGTTTMIGGIILVAAGLHRVLYGIGVREAAVAWMGGGIALMLFPFVLARVADNRRLKVSLQGFGAAAGSFFLAGMYVFTWAAPEKAGPRSVELMVSLLALEFILVHSAPFLGAVLAVPRRTRKWYLSLAGLVGLYLPFAAGISASCRSWAPMVVFLTMVFSKLFAAFLRPKTAETPDAAQSRWGFSAMAYLLCAFVSVFVPFPELGATMSFGSGEGLWNAHPERALGAAAFYYTVVGLFELFDGRLD